jgi:hypothetical protein
MARSFICDLNGDPDIKIGVLKRKAAEKGIRFIGDTASGSFSGWGLRGDYAVRGMQVVVTIHSLPPLYTFDAAEAQIRGFLEE